MSPLQTLLLGVVGGVLMTAPVGPVNVVIIQRAFRHGFFGGIPAGVGAAVADVVFAFGAAFSISTVTAFVQERQALIQLVGGLLMVLFGARIVLNHEGFGRPIPPPPNGGGAVKIALTTFAITITNPATVMGFVAYFSALGEWGPRKDDLAGTLQLVGGVALGAVGWWIGLTGVVSRLRVHLSETTLANLNIVSGMVLVAFGAAILGRLSVTYFNIL